ncbi:dimethylarginine dimethylaminohydrolase family protein [Planococcus salinus]|uniref:N-dimethylarginine dimethylaminohydrolase n=1 Tax=Planococcus salinus TaxID=1848460 RepID=A0A3M8P4V9_9BACL|nr:arginine deiminase family protein [Planococcus salinus]RNF38697.1 hypothetical protein EEX84_12725 [Planococcus salinus]
MSSSARETPSASCYSEYDTLHCVLLCPPTFMEIKDVINAVQKRYKDENIDSQKAFRQHEEFVRALSEQGVETEVLEPSKQFPEQVFTRDIGFTVGRTVFVGEMASDVRQGEEAVLQNWLNERQLDFDQLTDHHIEGGDVLLDRNTVFVGVSSRTSGDAVEKLKKKLPEFQVVPVSFDEKYLHLDCVFNILSPTEALIFRDALSEETIQMLEERYTLIDVNPKEQFQLGTNVLSIGGRRVFTQPQNKEVNRQLKAHGFQLIEVDFSEIIKSGGAFRCCTLPLIRAENEEKSTS